MFILSKAELWEQITKEKLMELAYEQNLSDRQIAELYGVTIHQVRYKRNRFGVSLRNKMYGDILEQRCELYNHLNSEAKKELLKRENIDGIAKALTQYVFRSGPVEDMHAAGKLTQEDMKTLNKFMVNRLAGIITAICDGKWVHLGLLLASFEKFSTNWDPAEPDMELLEFVFHHFIDSIDK